MAMHVRQKSSFPVSLITLSSGSSVCTIAPAVGGSIASWHIDGQPMLRSAAAGATDPRDMASFPLLPYSNRIARGRFSVGTECISLAQTWPDEQHVLHGVGMLLPWDVVEIGPDIARLRLSYRGEGNWPFAFEAEQRIGLTANGLELGLTVTNRHDAVAPAAFGHHPYFDADRARLRFSARRVWSNGPSGLPETPMTPHGDFDFSDAPCLDGRSVDHCYTGWNGTAEIDWAGRPLRLVIEASPSLPAAVLFVPDSGDFFCFEPVPHLTDAINRPDCDAPMPMLATGESFSAGIMMRALQAQLHP